MKEGQAGTFPSKRQRVDLSIFSQTIPIVLCVDEGAVGTIEGGAGGRRVLGCEVDQFEDMGVLQPYPFGQELCVEDLLVECVKLEGLLADELVGELIANQGG